MNTLTATGPMTAEEFAEWVELPENRNRCFELVRGKVMELLPSRKIYGATSANAVRILGNYVARRRQGYILCDDVGLILERDPDTVRGLDVALYEDASRVAVL